MTSDNDLADLEHGLMVVALAASLRSAATELVLAHHIVLLLGGRTNWFIESAQLVVDLAHDIDPIPTKETQP